MSHIVQCRQCKEKINIEESNNWIMSSKNKYYHRKCYDDFKNIDKDVDKNDEEWIDNIYDLLSHDLKTKYNFFQCKTQIDNFLKSGMTKKGIFLTLYYYYILNKNKWEEKYGISIVPKYYKETRLYFIKRAMIQKALLKKDKNNNKIEKKKIPYNQKEKEKEKTLSLDNLLQQLDLEEIENDCR